MPWKEKDISDNRQLPQVPTGWRKATLGLHPHPYLPTSFLFPSLFAHILALTGIFSASWLTRVVGRPKSLAVDQP